MIIIVWPLILFVLQDAVRSGHAKDGGAGEGALPLPDHRRGPGQRDWLPGGGRAQDPLHSNIRQ